MTASDVAPAALPFLTQLKPHRGGDPDLLITLLSLHAHHRIQLNRWVVHLEENSLDDPEYLGLGKVVVLEKLGVCWNAVKIRSWNCTVERDCRTMAAGAVYYISRKYRYRE